MHCGPFSKGFEIKYCNVAAYLHQVKHPVRKIREDAFPGTKTSHREARGCIHSPRKTGCKSAVKVLFLKTGLKNGVNPVLSPLFIVALEKNGVKTGSVGLADFRPCFSVKRGRPCFTDPVFLLLLLF